MLGRDVVGRGGEADQAGNGSRIDDRAAAALRQHLRYFVFEAEKDAGQVDRQHAIERLLAELVQTLARGADGARRDARIVERAIDPPEG